MDRSGKRQRTGFTLAELLLALVILGVIATFAIPKMLASQQDSKRKSVMRECVASAHAGIMDGFRSGQMSELTMKTYLVDQAHLNYVKKCTSSEAQGCWTAGYTSGQTTGHGIVMHNGCSVVGFDNTYTGTHEFLVFDWNGSALPNAEGQDQMELKFALPPQWFQWAHSGLILGQYAHLRDDVPRDFLKLTYRLSFYIDNPSGVMNNRAS